MFTDIMVTPAQAGAPPSPPWCGLRCPGPCSDHPTSSGCRELFSLQRHNSAFFCVWIGPQEMGRYRQGLTDLSVTFVWSSPSDKGILERPHLLCWSTIHQLLHSSKICMVHWKQAASFPPPPEAKFPWSPTPSTSNLAFQDWKVILL